MACKGWLDSLPLLCELTVGPLGHKGHTPGGAHQAASSEVPRPGRTLVFWPAASSGSPPLGEAARHRGAHTSHTARGPPRSAALLGGQSSGTVGSALNYELFNSSNVSIGYWSWNYRGCWHQTYPPVDTHCGV